jgi:hypothetical protein
MFPCYFFFQILVTLYCDTGKERNCTGAASSKYEVATAHAQRVLIAYGKRGGEASCVDHDNNGDE